MHLLYVDESGTPGDPSTTVFVFAGVSVFERQTWWIAQKLDDIAKRFDPEEPGKVEFHASPMRSGKGFWKGLSVEDRLNAFSDALDVLANSHKSNRIFICAIDPVKASPSDPVELAFEQIASRFDRYLQRLHTKKDDSQRGVMIFDKSSTERTIQNLANNFRTVGHSWGVLRNQAEVPLFLDSKASRLIQLADLVAHSAFRHYNFNDSMLFDRIKHRIDTDNGIQHGLFELL